MALHALGSAPLRYVFVTDELPRAGVGGHLAYNHAVIRWLAGLGHRVEVILVGSRLAAPVVYYGVAPVMGPAVWGVGNFVVSRAPAGVLARAAVRRLPPPLAARVRRARHSADAIIGGFMSPEAVTWCAGYVDRTRPDGLLIDTIFRADLLAAPQLQGMNSVVLAHDVFHRRHAALVSAGYRVQPAELSRELEALSLSHARHVAAIQPDEAMILAAMCPSQNVFAAPMPAIPCPRPAGCKVELRRLVFVGSATLPNLDGLRWFFDAVWPLLQHHDVRLDLVGDCGAALPNMPQGVHRLGRVADLSPVLHRAALAIAPLRVGSGLKIKLLDYARHGLFTIATPASVVGFASDEAAPFAVADNANDFATLVLRFLEARPSEDLALGYVTSHYGEAESFKLLKAALGLDRLK